LNLPRRATTKGPYAATHRRNACGKTESIEQEGQTALTMKLVPPDTSLKDYKTRRSIPRAADRINAERERSRQGVPAVDGRKLTLSRR